MHMAFAKSNLCRSEGACSSRPKSLLAVVETLRSAQGDMFFKANKPIQIMPACGQVLYSLAFLYGMQYRQLDRPVK